MTLSRSLVLLLIPHSGRHTAKKNAVLRTARGVRNAPHVVEAQRDYHTQARTFMGPRAPLAGPLRCTLDFVAPWPELVGVPDVNNLASLVHDALEGAAYVNDAQLVEVVSRKLRGERVECRVEISPCAPL